MCLLLGNYLCLGSLEIRVCGTDSRPKLYKRCNPGEANRRGKENEEGKMVDRSTEVYCWPGCIFLENAVHCSATKPSLLVSCEPPYLRKKVPARIHQLLFIIGLYHLSLALPVSIPHSLLSYDVLSLGKLREKPFYSRWCHASSEPKSAGEVSTSISLVRSDLSLKKLQIPCFNGQNCTHAGAQTLAVSARLPITPPGELGGRWGWVNLKEDIKWSGTNSIAMPVFAEQTMCSLTAGILSSQSSL